MACVRPVKTIGFLVFCCAGAVAATPRRCFGGRARVVSVAKAPRGYQSRARRRGRAPVISPAETKGLRGAGARLGLTKLRSVVSYVKTASHGCLLRALLLSLGCFASLREDAMPNIMSSVMSH